MRKVVPYFKSFTIIFYFKMFERGKPFLDQIIFGQNLKFFELLNFLSGTHTPSHFLSLSFPSLTTIGMTQSDPPSTCMRPFLPRRTRQWSTAAASLTLPRPGRCRLYLVPCATLTPLSHPYQIPPFCSVVHLYLSHRSSLSESSPAPSSFVKNVALKPFPSLPTMYCLSLPSKLAGLGQITTILLCSIGLRYHEKFFSIHSSDSPSPVLIFLPLLQGPSLVSANSPSTIWYSESHHPPCRPMHSYERTTSKMRGLSPKIISGDSRQNKNTQTQDISIQYHDI
jgi:hypothetical protein